MSTDEQPHAEPPPIPPPLPTPTASPRKSVSPIKVAVIVVCCVVAAVVAIVALGITSATRISSNVSNAKMEASRLLVNSGFDAALMSYDMDMGEYPSTAEGLQALVTAPAGKADGWRGPYLINAKMLLDPWEHPYQYRFPGIHNKNGFDIWSKGPDGQSGTADDIGNWHQ